MIPFQPIAKRTEGRDRRYLLGRNLFMSAAIAMAALAVMMVLVGLVFAGGRVGPVGDPIWDVVVPWPVVPIPAWLVIGLGCVPPVAALILVPRAKWEQIVELNYLLMLTVVLFVVVPVAFSRLYPTTGGVVFDSDHPELGLADHWWAAVPQALTVACLVWGMVRVSRVHRRAAIQGEVSR